MSQEVAQGRHDENRATEAGRSGGGGEVVGPLLHERPAALEQVATAVGGLDAVAVDMGERELADLARRLGALGWPVQERGTELVRYGANSKLPH